MRSPAVSRVHEFSPGEHLSFNEAVARCF